MKLKCVVQVWILSSAAILNGQCQVPVSGGTPSEDGKLGTATSVTPSDQPSATAERPVSWKRLPLNLLSDQKRIWSFPIRLSEGEYLAPTAAVIGTMAALVALDPSESAYFRRTRSFHTFNNIFTGNVTTIGIIVAPTSLYAVGLWRRDSKMQRTALLAGEAIADAEVVTTALKDITRRVRPAGVSMSRNFWDTWFESGGSVIRGSGSFPSGHTIAAFSAATVIARRYGKHRWIPYVAYGAASLVGFSRLSLSAHFLSDVFMGGALGYSISRFAVLRQ